MSKILKAIDDPYTRLVADIADLRSAGLKDLGDATLRHEDRLGKPAPLRLQDPRHPVPLLPSIQHYLIAGSLLVDRSIAPLFGDVLVPLASATNGICLDRASLALAPKHVRVLGGLNHVALSRSPLVYAEILSFLKEPP